MARDIWRSFQALPLWVRLWVGLGLVPVNAAALAFVGFQDALGIVVLALAGMVLNLPIMLVERGFSRAMAFPHLLCWGPMLVVIAVLLSRGVAPPALVAYLWLLLAVDLVSLAFDLRDARAWLRGDRAVSGRGPPAARPG